MTHIPRVVVSVHDVSPATGDETIRWCADADSLGVAVSLLVIPGPWRGTHLAEAPDFASILRGRVARGDDVVLHGWTHVAGPEGPWWRRAAGRAIARGAAEFAALGDAEAAERLWAGRAVLGALDLATEGFTPPGWLASPGAMRALRQGGFRFVTTHVGLRDLRTGRLHRAFALSHRPTGGRAERVGAAVMRSWARRGAIRGSLVRIALHPDDLRRPALRDTTLRSIEAVLAAGGHAVTYSRLAETG
jgi:predicted deacetylase